MLKFENIYTVINTRSIMTSSSNTGAWADDAESVDLVQADPIEELLGQLSPDVKRAVVVAFLNCNYDKDAIKSFTKYLSKFDPDTHKHRESHADFTDVQRRKPRHNTTFKPKPQYRKVYPPEGEKFLCKKDGCTNEEHLHVPLADGVLPYCRFCARGPEFCTNPSNPHYKHADRLSE